MKTITALFLIFTLTACGIFKKDKRIQKTEVRKEVFNTINTDIGVSTKASKIETEVNEIIIRGVNKSDLKNTQNADDWDNLHEAIIRAIANSEETVIRSSRQVDSSTSIVDTTKKSTVVSEKLDSTVLDKDVKKDSNTTIAANVPFYVYIIGAVLVLGVVWISLKRFKIF